jgi:hypothetical protein
VTIVKGIPSAFVLGAVGFGFGLEIGAVLGLLFAGVEVAFLMGLAVVSGVEGILFRTGCFLAGDDSLMPVEMAVSLDLLGLVAGFGAAGLERLVAVAFVADL